MKQDAVVYVAGHRGLVGSAIQRLLVKNGFHRIVTATRDELDLRNPNDVDDFFAEKKPEYVFLAAAVVGGILANASRPVEFLAENLQIELSVVQAAHKYQVRKLLFLGSSCIYPRLADQPITEDALLTGLLEPTNEAYAIAKIAGIKLCQAYRAEYGDNFISAMPTNLYGPNDSFDLASSHVLPALIRKFHEAQESGATSVVVWGTGKPRREFLHVDDLASACLFLMNHYDDASPINVGVGSDISIGELARLIAGVVGYKGETVFDTSKPDGTPRKLLDVSRLSSIGWKASIGLEDGVRSVYADYKAAGALR